MKEFTKILKDLQRKEYKPLYFLSGAEPYFIDRIAGYIAENVLDEQEKGFNQTILYGKDTDPDAIVNMARRYPVMSEYQVIIIREAQEIKDLKKLLPYFENPVSTTILVLCYKYKKVDGRTKMKKVLDKNAVVFESRKLYADKVPDWIKKQAESKSLKINQNAVMLLSEYIGDDLHKIDNAIEKLSIRKEGGEEVTLKDIEENIGISRDFNVFELQKALGQRDHKKLARIIDYMQANPNQNPFPQIIGALFNYFSKIIILQFSKDNTRETARKINVPEFFLGEYQQAGNNYRGRLQKVIQLLHEYDLRSKGINDAGTNQGELLREMTMRILSV